MVDFMKRNGASKKPATGVVWQQLEQAPAGRTQNFVPDASSSRTKQHINEETPENAGESNVSLELSEVSDGGGGN